MGCKDQDRGSGGSSYIKYKIVDYLNINYKYVVIGYGFKVLIAARKLLYIEAKEENICRQKRRY